MQLDPLADVYTPDELARAAGVPPSDVAALAAKGALRLIPGTRFVAGPEAVTAGRQLRAAVAARMLAPHAELFAAREPAVNVQSFWKTREIRMPAMASSMVHAAV